MIGRRTSSPRQRPLLPGCIPNRWSQASMGHRSQGNAGSNRETPSLFDHRFLRPNWKRRLLRLRPTPNQDRGPAQFSSPAHLAPLEERRTELPGQVLMLGLTLKGLLQDGNRPPSTVHTRTSSSSTRSTWRLGRSAAVIWPGRRTIDHAGGGRTPPVASRERLPGENEGVV